MIKKTAPRITAGPKVRSGKSVIRGSRVPVDLILGKLATGMTAEQVASEYQLDREDIMAVLSHVASKRIKKFGDSLRGYGHKTHVKYNFKCQLCGYDGRAFPNWFQLTVDHIRPKGHGGSNKETNKITVCHACNSITSRMKFEDKHSRAEIIRRKRVHVRKRQSEYFEFWQENVSHLFLKEWEVR
jgi:uncharacterized protein (DUF433 family)